MAVPDRKQLGDHLKKLRKEAGYRSSRAFAESIGIPNTRYVEYEQGRVPLSFETAWLIADFLGIPLDAVGGRVPPSSGTLPSGLTVDESEVLGKYRALTPSSQMAASAMLDGLTARIKESSESSTLSDEELSA